MNPELDALPSYMGSVLAHMVTEEYDAAINDLNELIKLMPDNASASFALRGDAYLKKGQFDEAISDFTDAIRLDPNYVDAYIRL